MDDEELRRLAVEIFNEERRDILPREVIDFRAHLVESWSAGPIQQARAAKEPFDVGDIADLQYNPLVLRKATLWWVAGSMLDVLLAAARDVPTDVTLEEVAPLATVGLVFLERRWWGHAENDSAIPVDAFAWAPRLICEHEPECEFGSCAEPRPVVEISSYASTEVATLRRLAGRDAAPRAKCNGLAWSYEGASQWPLGRQLGDVEEGQEPLSVTEDRRNLVALMLLLAHDGIASREVAYADRSTRRRLERSGHDLLDTSYRIVTLRSLRRPDIAEDGQQRSIEHDHRWIVHGHMRRQPYGPGNSLRRLQWVNPYIKGPEDAPLAIPTIVHAWRR